MSFSDEDRVYIHQICAATGAYQSSLMNLLDDHLEGKLVRVNVTERTVMVLFDEGEASSDAKAREFTDRLVSFERIMVRLLALLKYLEDNRYLITYCPTTPPTPQLGPQILEFGQGNPSHFVQYDIPDPKTVSLVLRYVDKELIPMPSLISLVNNGFKSDEDVRHGKMLRVSWSAVAVAVSVGILSLFVPTWRSCSQDAAMTKQQKAEAARWQALLTSQSNAVAELDGLARGLERVAEAAANLTNEPLRDITIVVPERGPADLRRGSPEQHRAPPQR